MRAYGRDRRDSEFQDVGDLLASGGPSRAQKMTSKTRTTSRLVAHKKARNGAKKEVSTAFIDELTDRSILPCRLSVFAVVDSVTQIVTDQEEDLD